VGPRSAVGTVVAGLVVMLVGAACVSVEPATLRPGSSASGGLAASTFGTQQVASTLPAATPGSPQPPTATAFVVPTSVPTTGGPITPSEASASPLPPSESESSPPEPSILPSETAAPSDTASPLPSASPRPTLAPGAGLGADTLESQDDFSQPGSWGTASDASGSVAYVDDALAITVNTATSGLWSWHVPTLPEAHRVLRVVGTIDVGGSRAGLMCGNGTPDFLFGVISWDGRWYVGSIVSRSTTTLASGDLPEGAMPDASGHADLSVECAVTGGATDRVLVRVNGIQVADFDSAPEIGPFDHAAVYGEAGDSPPQTVTFDDVSILSGDTYTPDGKLDPAVQELLGRVPRDYRGNCTPNVPAGDAGLLAWLDCRPAGDVDEAQYYQYQNKSTLNAAFDSYLKREGQGATGIDCEQRPSTVNYTIRNPNTGVPEHAGRLACYPDPNSSGRLYMWTDEKLAILSFGVSTGSYMDLWNWWLDAGPNR
jgi:hypothetical protein